MFTHRIFNQLLKYFTFVYINTQLTFYFTKDKTIVQYEFA